MESRNALRRRIRRLLLDVERSQLRAVVLVGHSFLFRELFRMAIVEGAAPPEVVEQLTQHKAGHCDVVRCEMNLGNLVCGAPADYLESTAFGAMMSVPHRTFFVVERIKESFCCNRH